MSMSIGFLMIFISAMVSSIGMIIGGLSVSIPFFNLLGFEMELIYLFDFVGMLFVFVVSVISASVFFYVKFYMGSSVFLRFNFLVFLFVVSMLLLVFSGNFISMMIGWDGLGVVSFALIIYYNNEVSISSGLLTIMVNRFGDAFMIMALCCYWNSWYSFSGMVEESSYFVAFILTIGAITKSAQYPFSTWLPAAMTAPTPVSSLVHSSTLVTAGIFVMIRVFDLISLSGVSCVTMVLGILTMIMGGLMAVMEADLKKVVAYSTLSQLGLMMFVLSSGEWELCFLHLLSHALFKSMLFMSCGCFMSVGYGNQDGRQFGIFGGSYFLMGVVLGLSCLSLAGCPILGGFISKDAVLESSMEYTISIVMVGLFYAGCILTIAYSLKIFFGGLSYGKYGNIISPSLQLSKWFGGFIPLVLANITCVIICEEILLGMTMLTGSQDLKFMDLILIITGIAVWFLFLGKYNSHSSAVISDFFFLGNFIWLISLVWNKMGEKTSNSLESAVESFQAKLAIAIGSSEQGNELFLGVFNKKTFLLLICMTFLVFMIFKLSSME